MGRDPRRQRLVVAEDDDDDDTSYGHTAPTSETDSDEEDSLFGDGCYSSPGYLAINMINDQDTDTDDETSNENLDSWMKAALALSASIDEVSIMIQRKAASYVSSTDVLNICFNNGNSIAEDDTMTNADRSIFETTVASFAAGMAKQIDSLRQTVVVEGDHPFIKTSDNCNSNSTMHNWASGPIGHRAAIASCLMLRLKSEIMYTMTKLQSQREKSKNNNQTTTNVVGMGRRNDDAPEIARNPLQMFRCLGMEDSTRRSLPPAPWELGDHDPEKDRAEREQEETEFVGVYFVQKEPDATTTTTTSLQDQMLPPSSVLKFMDLPAPSPAAREQSQPLQPPQINRNIQPQTILPNYNQQEEEEHFDQLQQESATLLATYQHSSLDSVQKVERSMVEITTLLSRFTDLITDQSEDIFMIHDQALKSKENVDKGQDQLVDAARRGEKSKHPMAMFIFVMAILLLLFNWITP